MTKTNIAKRVRQIREQYLEISIRDLSTILELSERYIREVEGGWKYPHRYLEALCLTFDIDSKLVLECSPGHFELFLRHGALARGHYEERIKLIGLPHT